MIDDRDWSRLARYFAGEGPADEALATQRWLAEDPARQHEAERLLDLWRASASPEWVPDTNASWQQLSARMHVSAIVAPVVMQGPHPQDASASRFRWQRSDATTRVRRTTLVAASLLVVVGALVVARQEGVVGVRAGESVDRPMHAREFRTTRGQRAVIMLADGTRVELGAESILRVEPFVAGPRVLSLTGQAVFDVVHDTAHAFVVHAANAITEDLGTRFTIRAYPGDSRVQVLVSSGKVALRAVGTPLQSGTLLGPLDLGILDSTGRTTVRNGADSTEYLAWTRDRIVLENAPLGEVLREIARWFDVEIDAPDPRVLQRRITINVPVRSLSQVLGAATVPLNLTYITTGRTVVIH